MIQLRAFTRSDYAQLISWISNAEMLMQFAGPRFTFPLTASQLDGTLNEPNRYAFAVTENGKTIGHAEIYIGTTKAWIGRIIIGDPTLRGKGKGKQLMDLLLQIVFIQHQQQVVELNVFDWNTAAIKCYESMGFVINPNGNTTRHVNGEARTVLNMVKKSPAK